MPRSPIDARRRSRIVGAAGGVAAAIADRHGLGVLHYDDFDLLRSKTDLDFESVWLVPRGKL